MVRLDADSAAATPALRRWSDPACGVARDRNVKIQQIDVA
jgi:hypothetical protein